MEQAKTRDRKVMITSVAIEKVPRVKVRGWSEAQCDLFYTAHKEVLRTAQRENESNEVALAYNIYILERAMVLGDADHI